MQDEVNRMHDARYHERQKIALDYIKDESSIKFKNKEFQNKQKK